MSNLRNVIGGLGTLHSERDRNGRGTSVSSTGSFNQRLSSAVGNNRLLDSEHKSLVRVALKNQRRHEKVAGLSESSARMNVEPVKSQSR